MAWGLDSGYRRECVCRGSQGRTLASHDSVVWFGDFNYRIDMENAACRRCCAGKVWRPTVAWMLPFG
jgi:hypothetical protein